MRDINQIINNIKEIIERKNALSYKKKKTLSHLFDLRIKEEIQDPSNFKFLDIVMETFKLNPEFFKGWLYENLLRKVEKLYGNEKRKEFEIYIIEKYCLFNGEKILYICKGNISQKRRRSYRFYVDQGTLFVTTDRIIALGRLKVFEEILYGEYRKAKSFMMGLSGPRELLFYGYQFPIINPHNLKKKSRSIEYTVNRDTYIEISFTKSINSISSIEERRDRLFEILDKEPTYFEVKEEQILPEKKEVVKLTEVCKFCGATILAGKTYCSNCGKLLKIPIEEKLLVEKELVKEKLIQEEFLPEEELVVEEPIEKEILPEEELVVEESIKDDFLIEEEVLEEQIEEEVLPEEEIVVKEPAEEIFFSCIFCGMKLDKEAKVCLQCGTIVKKK